MSNPDPEDVLFWAISRMHHANNAIKLPAQDLSLMPDMYDMHQLRLALEAIADDLLMDGLQA